MPQLQQRNQLQQKINEKLERLRVAVGQRIVSGFTSGALGSNHFYPSSETDQLTLIGAAGTGESRTYPCVPEGQDPLDNSNWIASEHTNAQLAQLLSDGADIIQNLKNDYRARVTAALAATSETELDTISEAF